MSNVSTPVPVFVTLRRASAGLPCLALTVCPHGFTSTLTGPGAGTDGAK